MAERTPYKVISVTGTKAEHGVEGTAWFWNHGQVPMTVCY